MPVMRHWSMTEFEAFDDIAVTRFILASNIIEEFSTRADHFDQTVSRTMVLTVSLEMVS